MFHFLRKYWKVPWLLQQNSLLSIINQPSQGDCFDTDMCIQISFVTCLAFAWGVINYEWLFLVLHTLECHSFFARHISTSGGVSWLTIRRYKLIHLCQTARWAKVLKGCEFINRRFSKFNGAMFQKTGVVAFSTDTHDCVSVFTHGDAPAFLPKDMNFPQYCSNKN